MPDEQVIPEADQTAVRVALWRALHLERRPEYAGRLRVFEIDQPAPQAWKRRRLTELGYGVPAWLHLVSVDFEAGASWWDLLAALAPGSTVAMTFLLPAELLDERDRPGLAMAANGARASGTPFISYYSPDEIVALAREAGFAEARHVPAAELNDRYFAGRAGGLRMSTGEDLLVATV